MIIPAFLAHLKRHGEYPVPFVMLWVDGKPDFRAVDVEKLIECFEGRLCGICGRRLGELAFFIGGDACKRSHLFQDPAMHPGCAWFAASVCPFLNGERRSYSPRPLPRAEGVVVGERPGFVPENNWMLKTRTRKIQMHRLADGNVCFRAPGLWLATLAISQNKRPRYENL